MADYFSLGVAALVSVSLLALFASLSFEGVSLVFEGLGRRRAEGVRTAAIFQDAGATLGLIALLFREPHLGQVALLLVILSVVMGGIDRPSRWRRVEAAVITAALTSYLGLALLYWMR